MGSDCSRPSYTETLLCTPCDSLRLCPGSSSSCRNNCWCAGTQRRSHYSYTERDSYGREMHYDPFEFMDRAFLNASLSGGNGYGGAAGSFGGRAAWKDPSLWTTRDYERLSEVMGEYLARERGKSRGVYTGSMAAPVYGGPMPVGVPMSMSAGGAAAGIDANSMWQFFAMMGMGMGPSGGGGGPGCDTSRSGSGRRHRSSGYLELSEQIRRLEEVYKRDKEMSDAMLFGTEAERREKAWQQRLLKQMTDVWPQFMQMQMQQQQQAGAGMMGMSMPSMGMGMNPMMMGGNGMGQMNNAMAGGNGLLDGDLGGLGNSGGGLGMGRRRGGRLRRALADYDDLEEPPWGRSRRRGRRSGFDDDDDDIDMLGNGGRRGPKGPAPSGPSRFPNGRNSDSGGDAAFFPGTEGHRQSDHPAAQPTNIPSQRPSPRVVPPQPMPSARTSPGAAAEKLPEFRPLFGPGANFDTGPDIPARQQARPAPWGVGWPPEGQIPVSQGMPHPQSARFGADPLVGEPPRYMSGDFRREHPAGLGVGAGIGFGGIARPETTEPRVRFGPPAGPATGLEHPTRQNSDEQNEDTEAGARAARANRTRGGFPD